MNFRSTRSDETVSASYALLHGLARDGGLYVPETFPEQVLTYKDLAEKSYQEIAATVLFFHQL
jgi:threonine synthase